MGEYINIVVIPAYQPDRKLVKLVESLVNTKKYKIIVVDDGSLPDTKCIFDEIKKYVTVIYHMENRGKGAAIKTALSYIKKHYNNAIVTTADADGQHTISAIENVSLKAQTADGGIAIGSRAFEGKVPFKSKFGNKITCKIFKMASGIYLSDTQTGLRSFKSSLISYLLDIDGNRYEYEMNMLLKCTKDKISITQVPISTIYLQNNRSSHFRTVRDSFCIYKSILKFSMS